MARSNVFVKAGNDHREVPIGGRKNSDSGFSWINVDTNGGEQSITTRANYASGNASFTIELSDMNTFSVVTINGGNANNVWIGCYSLAELLRAKQFMEDNIS